MQSLKLSPVPTHTHTCRWRNTVSLGKGHRVQRHTHVHCTCSLKRNPERVSKKQNNHIKKKKPPLSNTRHARAWHNIWFATKLHMHTKRLESRPEGTLTLHVQKWGSWIQLRSSKAPNFSQSAKKKPRRGKKMISLKKTKCPNCSRSHRRVWVSGWE